MNIAKIDEAIETMCDDIINGWNSDNPEHVKDLIELIRVRNSITDNEETITHFWCDGTYEKEKMKQRE